MGSVFNSGSETVSVPTVPTTSVRDEINNVETIPVTNADGSITYITRELELSKEDQAQKDKLESIMQTAMDEIVALSESDYELDETSQATINSWKAEQEKNLSNTYSEREQEEEKTLARRGLSESSAGINTRRQRQLDKQDAQEGIESASDSLESDIRTQQLALQQNLYNLASSATNGEIAAQQQAATQGLSLLAANESAKQASLTDYYNYQSKLNNGTSVFGDVTSSLLNSLNDAGSSLGSLFDW